MTLTLQTFIWFDQLGLCVCFLRNVGIIASSKALKKIKNTKYLDRVLVENCLPPEVGRYESQDQAWI